MIATHARSVATSLAGSAIELSLVALLRGLGIPALIVFAAVQLVGATFSFTLDKSWELGAAGSGAAAAELSRAAPVLAGAFALVYAVWSFPLNRRWVSRMTRSCVAEAAGPPHGAAMVGPTLYPRSRYVHELRSALPAAVFAPARGRLLRVPLHVAVALAAIAAIARGWLPWPLVPVASLAIGINFACLTFIAHEALHGGLTRSRWLQRLAGWIGFLPFAVSPSLWIAWHNRDHHAHAQMPGDPDGYPTLERYAARASTRFSVDRFSLAGGRWRGALSLLLGFTVQSADQLFSSRALTPRQRRRAFTDSALMLAVWVGLALAIGLVPFVFAYLVPLLVANACVMAFIVTNHSLCPRVEVDDPLVSSLSVTTPRVVDWLSLGFGYHVEHHLFPAMSTRHAPAVRAQLIARWPERYQSMPLIRALSRLHRTARVYKHHTTLFDPKTAREYPTLLPRATA